MRTSIFLLFALILFTLSNCGPEKSKTPVKTPMDTAAVLALGDSIAAKAQSTLMQNVSQAIQKGGTEYAVEFCNLEAIPLTDSVARQFSVHIQRLSDKNRNPDNALTLREDLEAWEELKSGRENYIRSDEEGRSYFYKPIFLAMNTCLACHGDKNDISESTLVLINQKYPDDKATGYAPGELRGMWKIRLQHTN